MRTRLNFRTVRCRNPEDVIPNGLHIIARETDNLCKGFPYPKALSSCGVLEKDWQVFCDNLAYPVFLDGDLFNSPSMRRAHGFHIEKVLDIAANWDMHYFRPRGIIMRVDMPGEEKFGMGFMDIYHYRISNKRAHVDNLTQPSIGGAIRRKRPRSGHLRKLRLLARETTRIVLDPVSILHDLGQAYVRGWTNWIRACNDAYSFQDGPSNHELVASEQSTEAGIPSEKRAEQGVEVVDVGRPTEADMKSRDNKYNIEMVESGPPSNTTTPTESLGSDDVMESEENLSATFRDSRWPASKLLYYDRFRGTQVEHVKQWIGDVLVYVNTFSPDMDSMDQRCGTSDRPRTVISCDEIQYTIFGPDTEVGRPYRRR